MIPPGVVSGAWKVVGELSELGNLFWGDKLGLQLGPGFSIFFSPRISWAMVAYTFNSSPWPFAKALVLVNRKSFIPAGNFCW